MAVSKGAPSRGALLSSLPIPRGRGASLAFYVGRRVLWMIPVLFFVILVTFSLAHLAPGSPWDQEGRQLHAEALRDLNAKYGLDQPIWKQFGLYVWNVLHLEFGNSYQYQNRSVLNLIIGSWPYTATIGVLAFVVIVPVGLTMGITAALRQNTWVDYLAVGFATFGASVPNFVIGYLLIITLSIGLNRATDGFVFLPTGGFGVDQRLIMPVLTLSVLPIAFITRLTRASTLEVLRQDFVRTAWAKGLREQLVVVRHVLKNSLIPVVSALGPLFAAVVTGSVIVESVFAIPGIGRTFVVAVSSRDYPMILGISIILAAVIAIANLVVDILYVFIDPRVRLN